MENMGLEGVKSIRNGANQNLRDIGGMRGMRMLFLKKRWDDSMQDTHPFDYCSYITAKDFTSVSGFHFYYKRCL